MPRASTIAICISISFFLMGCSTDIAPAIITFTMTKTPQGVVMETEPGPVPTVPITAISSETPSLDKRSQILESAVLNLMNATSFKLSAHEVRAYQVIKANNETRQVYGEFNTNYAVIRLPFLKVHATHEYRYNPQTEFSSYESYTYQENGRFFTQLFGNSITRVVEEVEFQQIEPFSGDVYQTLIHYADQARFVRDRDGLAVYVLDHPKWYTLEGAIGFADLGFLHGQENSEQLIEQYVAVHYPNVKTIVFTIYVAVDENWITRVEVNDNDFMASVWAEVDRALVEQGAKVESLSRYVIMDENGAEYSFSHYNQVQDFEISP